MRTLQNLETRVKSLAAVAILASLSAGCQLIVDFNRGLIDAGTVDGSFSDTGAPGVDAAKDALPVPDAVADVLYVDGQADAHDATTDVKGDAKGDANGDAKVDGSLDARAKIDAMDAAADTGTHDAHPDTADKDAHADGAPVDAADAG